jgi:hypothetical protein
MGNGSGVLNNNQSTSIKLIDFEDFCQLTSFPRYPENKNLVVDIEKIDHKLRDDSLIIFISHCWLRGWKGAEGWDGRFF